MSLEEINLGSGPNVGDGDKLRPAGKKINDNFRKVKQWFGGVIQKNPRGSATKFFNEKGEAVIIPGSSLSSDLDNSSETIGLNEKGANVLKKLIEYLPQAERDSGKKLDIVSGVIRNMGGTWEFIQDGEHLGASGFLRVETKPKYARIHYKENYGKILTLLASPDETYVQNGVSAGASVGTTYANVFLCQDIKLTDYVFYNGSNFQSYESIYSSFTYNNGVLKVEHTELMNGYDISVMVREGCPYFVKLGSIGEYSMELHFYNLNGTKYTGVATNDMKMFVSRNSNTELNNVTSRIVGSNIWVIGIMQKN